MRNYQPLPSGTDFQYHSIEAGNDTLMRQAQMTARTYMEQAVEDIDEIFGKGYAKAHPELVVGYMQTAAIDLGTAIIARAIEHTSSNLDSISHFVERISNGGMDIEPSE